MSLINTVRATVLSIANKNNFGYITPNDFNLYAKQAQLDLFEDYFYQYNSWNVKQNVRQSGTGYADIVKGLEEVVDSFSSTKALLNSSLNLFDLPEDYYLINKINYYPTLVDSGLVDSVTPPASTTLTDTTATFLSSGVQAGDVISNLTTGEFGYVQQVISQTALVGTQIWDLGNEYAIVKNSAMREIERVSQNKIFYLNASHLTQPSTLYPAYVLGGATGSLYGNTITVYPDSINTVGTVISQYIRYPKDPNWTYVQLPGGEPSFEETAADYQDFELPKSDETNLINKILQYAGVSIRDASIAQFGKAEETEANKQEGQ
jgi:hypothetical protein